MNLFTKTSSDGLKLTKAGSEWVVRNTYGVLYMGSREMCQTFMRNYATA